MDKKPAADAGKSRPSYANERVAEEHVRRIGHEVYNSTGYDAIWRLSNSGFVIRLGAAYIFFDPVLTSPLPDYEVSRAQAREAGDRPYRLELKYYDQPENFFREIHANPLPAEDVEKADYVLLSHEHHDHMDIHGLERLVSLDPTIVAPGSCHEEVLAIGYPDARIVDARHGETHDCGGFSVQVVPASHHGCADACGYLLHTRHGTIYFHGDGKFDHEDKETVVNLDVDYLLLPINDTNLGVGFAALLTHLLQPRVVIPCHYGYVYPPVRFQGGHPAEFVTALAARNYRMPGTDIMILNPGGKVVLV